MIKKIKIVNFRSCKEVVLDNLGPMTVLVGRNGTGKTNILKAIDWAAKNATATNSFKPWPNRFVQDRLSTAVEMEIELENEQFNYFLSSEMLPKHGSDSSEKLAVKQNGSSTVVFDRTVDKVVIDGGQNIKLQPNVPALNVLKSLLPPDHIALKYVNTLFDFLAAIRYDAYEEPNSWPFDTLISEPGYQQWKSTGERSTRTVLYQLLHEYLTHPESFKELKLLLGEKGLRLIAGIEVREITTRRNERVEEELKVFFIKFAPFSSPRRFFEFPELSLGTRRIIRILASMLFDKNSVTLGEQLEDGIHAGLLWKVISLLRTYCDSNQFILTTHSSIVVNALRPEDVRLVSMKNGETKVHALTAKERRSAESFVKDQGTLAEALQLIEEN